MWCVGVLLVITIGSGYRYLQSTKTVISESTFLLSLLILTFAPRLWWITHAGTLPEADFAGYHDYALQVASGNISAFTPVMQVFPFKFFYPLVLGGLYWLTAPSPFIAQLLNLVISLVLAYQVYLLGRRAGGEHVGRLASVLFAIWPSQIAFCSVVAQEHLFEVFFLGAILFLLRSQDSQQRNSVVVYGALTGALIAIAHALRPVALVVFPTLLAFVVWGIQGIQNTLRSRAALLLSCLGGFALAFAIIMLPTARAVNYPVWKSSAGFSAYVGTSTASNGFWSAANAQILDEYSHDFDQVHAASMQRALDAVGSSPMAFLRLAATKFALFWGSDDYGVYFSTVEQMPTADAVTIFLYRTRINLFAQGAYLAILLCAAIGMYTMRRHSNSALLIIQSVFLLHVAAFSVLEIQSRYHFLVIPLLLVPAAMAWLQQEEKTTA